MLRQIAIGAAALSLCAGPAAALSVLSVELTETTAGVELHAYGSIDLTGLTFVSSASNSLGLKFVNPLYGAFGVGAGGGVDAWATVDTSPFGTISAGIATSFAGDDFGIAFSGLTPVILTPIGYVSGDYLDGTAFFEGASFSSLGVEPGPVEFHAPSTTFVLSFDPLDLSVPAPAAAPLMVASLLALIGLATRRRAG